MHCMTETMTEESEEFLRMIDQDETVLGRVWWSDEAMFKLNGTINRHNCVYWASENPHASVEKEVNLPGVTCWAAISSSGIIGPYFFETTVNSCTYLDMLENYFLPRVQDEESYFQHDGAPAHYGKDVRTWLDQNFAGKWFGRRGSVEWPPRSPDLTPPDFFLWGVLKDLVYREKLRSIPELKDIISAKMGTLDRELCQTVCRSVPARLRKCIEHEGMQFEFYRT